MQNRSQSGTAAILFSALKMVKIRLSMFAMMAAIPMDFIKRRPRPLVIYRHVRFKTAPVLGLPFVEDLGFQVAAMFL